VEVVEADFDEDAELQANIWNSLVRKNVDVSNENGEFKFIVTVTSVLR
jgi:hypothetical protein